MGIPKYFRQITKNNPDIIIDINNLSSLLEDDKTLIECQNIDNLFLDANCLIHPCVRKVLDSNQELIAIYNNEYKTNKNNIQNQK